MSNISFKQYKKISRIFLSEDADDELLFLMEWDGSPNNLLDFSNYKYISNKYADIIKVVEYGNKKIVLAKEDNSNLLRDIGVHDKMEPLDEDQYNKNADQLMRKSFEDWGRSEVEKEYGEIISEKEKFKKFLETALISERSIIKKDDILFDI